MSRPHTSDGQPHTIERFVTLVVAGLMAFAVAAAAANGIYSLVAQERRAAENARDAREAAAMTELIGLQKQIQLDVVQVQQFLTDVSATRGENGLDDGWTKAEKNAERFKTDSARARALADQMGAPDLAAAIDGAVARFDGFYAAGQAMAHAYVDQGPAGGNAAMPQVDAEAQAMTQALEATRGALQDLTRTQHAADAAKEQAMLSQQRLVLSLTAIAALITAVGGVAVIMILRTKLLRPLGLLVGYMGRLADGDYDEAVPVAASNTELGAMARSIAAFRDAAIERRDARTQREAERAEEDRARIQRGAERQAADETRKQAISVLAEGLTHLSEGDVGFRIRAAIAEEYVSLKDDFNGAAGKLETAMERIGHAAGAVGSSAEEIAAAADNLSRRTEHQAATLEQTAAALDQITVTVKQTAGRVAEARSTITETRADARQTEQVVTAAVGAVSEIESSSAQIAQIIGVIDEIAFQTNLLALNAGVEAARAGEAGKGFAVVASEVRALAQRSADAAKEIKTLISASSEKVTEGVQLVGQTGQALQRILERVESMSEIVLAISVSAQEQATGLSEVNTAVNQMDQVTQQNAAMVEQTTAAAYSLKEQYTTLQRLVSGFRLAQGAAASSSRTARRAA